MKKLLMILALALLIVPAISATAIASQTHGNIQKVSGEVVSIFPDSGLMVVKDGTGGTVSLSAGPNIDINVCQRGQVVTCKYNDQGMILSIAVTPMK